MIVLYWLYLLLYARRSYGKHASQCIYGYIAMYCIVYCIISIVYMVQIVDMIV